MALQMIPAIICPHEDAASGAAKRLLLWLRVKTGFLIWICTEKLQKERNGGALGITSSRGSHSPVCCCGVGIDVGIINIFHRLKTPCPDLSD